MNDFKNHKVIHNMEDQVYQQKYYVYIIRCNDNTHYVGRSKNISDRLRRHKKGEVRYTCNRKPLQLITYCVFFDEYQAVLFEKYLKSGSGRAFAKRHLL